MVVKATPAAPFVVTESELLLQILIVALDAPAHFGHENKLLKCRLPGDGSEKVFEWLRIAIGPFNEQSFFVTYGTSPIVAMCGTKPYGGKARGKCCVATFVPGSDLPGMHGYLHGQLLHRDWLVTGRTAQ